MVAKHSSGKGQLILRTMVRYNNVETFIKRAYLRFILMNCFNHTHLIHINKNI